METFGQSFRIRSKNIQNSFNIRSDNVLRGQNKSLSNEIITLSHLKQEIELKQKHLQPLLFVQDFRNKRRGMGIERIPVMTFSPFVDAKLFRVRNSASEYFDTGRYFNGL